MVFIYVQMENDIYMSFYVSFIVYFILQWTMFYLSKFMNGNYTSPKCSFPMSQQPCYKTYGCAYKWLIQMTFLTNTLFEKDEGV